MSLLSLEFMQRAMLAAVLTGLAAPAVGTYLVQRRLALMGDGIGHVALTGVALGLLTGHQCGQPSSWRLPERSLSSCSANAGARRPT